MSVESSKIHATIKYTVTSNNTTHRQLVQFPCVQNIKMLITNNETIQLTHTYTVFIIHLCTVFHHIVKFLKIGVCVIFDGI
jgi:hypothetical protein